MNRRAWTVPLVRMVALLACVAGAQVFALQLPVPRPDPAAQASKLNVLFLIADDLNVDLGVYGAPVATPNIDRLAGQGVRFDRAYTQYPLCNPSRASFLTGRRPDATGVLANPGPNLQPHFRTALPDAVTLPQIFKNNGYFSARVGKLYHYGVPNNIGTSSLDDFASWDLVINPRGHDREIHDRIFTIGQPGNFGGTLSWFADDTTDEEQTDGIGALEAVKLLERFARERRPFFLGMGFYRPHTPYVAPKKYFAQYPVNQITLPGLSEDDRARTPAAAYRSAIAAQDTMDDSRRREAIQAFRAATSFMDAQVGVVVRALDRLGLRQNTVVVFTSDHGYHLGDHGLWQKTSVFEKSARVPLVIVAPGARGNGRVTSGLVELVDLYRTLADLAGLSPTAEIEGTSLRPMLDNPGASVKNYAFTQVRNGYAVRTSRYRYVEWAAGAEGVQLFDMDRDPAETKNLAADPAQASTVAELRGVLAEYRARAKQ
ncbi:MAG: sulfatase [Vicinamibacterales bacterium]